MQLASHGARGVPRNASNMIPGGSTIMNSSRFIHIPSFARLKPPTTSGTAKKLLSQTRTLLTRFVGHLTAPGLQAHASSALAQSFHGSAPGRMSGIQERLSFPVRNALTRPVQPRYIPRGPAFVSRSVAQVGLGSARNFSSGRPVFQNLIENVPIAGRAFYEADWEINMKSERETMKKTSKTKKKAVGKEMLKPKKANVRPLVSVVETASEMDQYFAAPTTPAVTTYLLIPLVPTPSGRVPLPPDVPDHPSLLPLSTLASIHNSHEMHSLRVSALFSRLDAANVWEKGVVCSSYATRADAEGVCNILEVEFVGWSKAEVRNVIGESGTGWCVIEEVENQRDLDEDEDYLSDTSSILSGISGDISDSAGSGIEVEPAHSLVLPTLDMSFPAPPSASLSRTASYDMFSDVSLEPDPWADSSSDEGWNEQSYLGSSSDFARRVNADNQWSSSREISA